MPILLVANAHRDTDITQYLSRLRAWSNRRCSVYVRHKAGNHKQRSHAFPFLVCDIESLNPDVTTSRWLESDKPAVIVHDSTAPDMDELILEGGCNMESITYLQNMANLLEAFRNSTDNQQNTRRAGSALKIVQGCITRRAGQGSSASSASNSALATMLATRGLLQEVATFVSLDDQQSWPSLKVWMTGDRGTDIPFLQASALKNMTMPRALSLIHI